MPASWIRRAALALDPTQALAYLGELGGEAHWRDARMIAADALARGVATVLHGKRARAIAFSRDGSRLAVYEAEAGDVRIWNLARRTARVVHVGDTLVDIAIDPAGRLVGLSETSAFWRWDPRTQALELLAAPGPGRRGLLSPDGDRALTFDDDEAYVITAAGHARTVPGPHRTGSWSPDGRVAVLVARSAIERVDAETGEITRIGHELPDPHDVATDGTRVWVKVYDQERAERGEFPWHTIVDVTTGAKREFPWPLGRVAVVRGDVVATGGMQASSQQTTLAGGRKGRTNRLGNVIPADPAITLSDDHDLQVRLLGNPQIPQLATAAGALASVDQNGAIRIWRLPVAVRAHGDGRSTTSAGPPTTTSS
jgi:hypothetical protein